MKKLSMLLMVLVLTMGLLVGCGSSDDKENNNNQGSSNKEQAYTGYAFEINGTKIELNAKMEPIAAALGEPDSYFESESCAFQGLDKVYTYGSAVITTYPEDGVDYVYTIELKDDTVETAEGLYIGASKDDVLKTYGDEAEDLDAGIFCTKGESELVFLMDGDVVTNIVYKAITE